jgi:predicted metal-dependent phosphoesterase TrpH
MNQPSTPVLDLHVHTNRSDGRFEPGDVVEQAVRGGVGVLALTDHDIIGPMSPGVHTFGSRRIRIVVAAEVSGTHDGREFHLLVYFRREAPAGFVDFCQRQVLERAQRYDTAVKRLGLPGVSVAPADAYAGDLALTRHHLARALVEAGHASNVGEALGRYGTDATVPAFDVPFSECIRIARRFGGLVSWAHPPRQAIEAYLPALVQAGLHGLEGLRPGLRREDLRFYSATAKRHNLFLTGGSDWHGWAGATSLGLFQVQPDQVRPFLQALAA